MSMMKIRMTVFLLCSIFLLYAAEYTVPFLRQAPVLDGVLAPAEWSEALAISGAGNKLDPRLQTAYLGFDNDFVYLAFRSEMPLRGQLQVSPNPAAHVVSDDSLELWFLPPAEQRVLEGGKFGYFQFIVNSVGRSFARHHDPGYGLPAKEWQSGVHQQHRCEDGFWVAELAFPVQSFGLKDLSQDMDWRLLLVRNFRSEPNYQAPLTDANGFMNTASYSRFEFRRQTAAVQAQYSAASLRRLPASFKVLNRQAKSAIFHLQAKVNSAGNEKELTQSLQLAAGETGFFDLTAEVPEAETALQISISDATGELLWKRECQYHPPPKRLWFNMDSYSRLEQSLHAETKSIEYSNVKEAELILPEAEKMAWVPGRQKGQQALQLKTGPLLFGKVKMSIPGAVSIWVKPDAAAQTNYRRYFSSVFVSSGYIFCQEQNGLLYIGAHNFPGVGHKNLLVKRVPPPNEWSHLLLNLLPGRFEMYVNGIKRGELDHGIAVDEEKLGDFVLGNSAERNFAVSDVALYERPLTEAEIRTLSQGEAKVTGSISWFQVLEAVVLDLTANLTENSDTERFELQIRDQKEKCLQSFRISFKNGYDSSENNKALRRLHQKLSLSESLPDGEYFFVLLEDQAETPLLEKKFVVQKYAWLGNQLGLSRRLLPPFTPLRRQNNTISCLLRDYTLAASGLPAQVKALDKEILADAVKLQVEKNGQLEEWQASQLEFTREDEININYQLQLQSPSLKVRLQGEFEFDGLLKLDLFFEARSDTLPERVYLDIPIRQEFTQLFHACGEGLRMNPGGFLPEGQGRIWKSRSIEQTHISNFIPYLWVGDDERGISYGADWDKGWVHCEERDAVELHRHADGTVSIRLNLLNAPKKLRPDEPITIVLLASPVKPMPDGWRGWSDGFHTKATRITRCFYSNPYWGSYSSWTSRYPAFKDFNYIKKLVETKETGVIDYAYIKSWVDRVMQSEIQEAPIAHRSGRSYVERHTLAAFALCKGLFPYKEIATIYPYTCNITGADALPEFPVFKDEWQGGVHVYQSYSDYAIYYLNQMFDCGFGGVYDDNVFLAGKFHWATGNGYIDEQGNVRPSLGLWRVRNYHKRQLTLMVERGMEPWITVHHTNTNNLSVLGFATNTMGMEWKYGSHDFQERFSPDYIRAVCHGKQGGFYPTVLDGITGSDSPEKRSWATRTMLASLLPHEVRPTCPRSSDTKLIRETLDRFFIFGTHLPDCRFYAYWATDNPVRLSCPELLTASYQRGSKMLIFLGSFADQDQSDELSLVFAGEKARHLKSVIDLESGKLLPCSTTTLPLQVRKHDFVFLELEFE
ncbi:MAG: glycoside hydrolase domain-containing protein [Lentisphaeria bacterium]